MRVTSSRQRLRVPPPPTGEPPDGQHDEDNGDRDNGTISDIASDAVSDSAGDESSSLEQRTWKPILAGVLIGLMDVDIGQVGGGTLRLFDLLGLVVIGTGLKVLFGATITAAQKRYLLWCAFGMFSAINGVIFFRLPLVPAALFAIRPLQYLAVGLALTGIIRSRRDWTIFAGTALALILSSVMIDLFIRDDGGLGERIGLSYGGPFELACVAGGLMFASLRRYRSIGLAAPFFVVVLLSASRITVAVVVCLAAWFALRRLLRQPGLLIPAIVGIGAIAILLGPVLRTGVFDSTVGRFSQTGVLTEWRLSADVAEGLSPPRTFADVDQGTIIDVKLALPVDPEFDRSAMLRFSRWRLLLDRQNDQPQTMLFGLGPGGGSESVDGYYVRLLVETGWVGLVLYSLFLLSLLRDAIGKDPGLTAYIVVLCLSAVFVDVLIAAKAMTLLWLFVGNRE